MKNIHFIVSILFFLFSCSSIEHSNEIRNVVDALPDTVSVPEYRLKGDTLSCDALWPTDILAVDSFLLVAQHKDKDLIHVYGLNGFKKLGSFLNVGGGPNEVNNWNGFTQVWIEDAGVRLMVQSYPQYVAVLDLNESLLRKRAVFDEHFSFNTDSARSIFFRSNVAFKIEDRFLMTRAPGRVKSLVNYNASFQWYDYKQDEIGDVVYGMNQALFPVPFLYVNGGMCYNSSRGKLCYACRFINLFFILDVETNSSIQIVPNNVPTDLKRQVAERKDANYFQDVACTDEYVFLATYDGCSSSEMDENGVKVEVYDWEGKHVCRYLISHAINYMTVDSQGDKLYVVLPDGGIKYYVLPKKKYTWD